MVVYEHIKREGGEREGGMGEGGREPGSEWR